MREVLVQYLEEFSDLPHEELDKMARSVPVKGFEKASQLQAQGEPIRYCYFVLKGLVRQYSINQDGQEVTSAFYTEGQSINLYSGVDGLDPSAYSLDVIEESFLVVGDLSEEKDHYIDSPILAEMTRRMIEADRGQLLVEHTHFIASSPEERFRSLMEDRPSLIDRVPQHQLASYLGITPESLSRIKRRLSHHLRIAK